MSNFESERIVDWSHNDKRMLKYMLQNDGINFARYFFKITEGNKMVLNWHHYVIQYCLDAVLNLKINRLIVNIGPGYTKTMLAVVKFISRGLAINPRAKFIHSSFSKDLALDNSTKVKSVVESPEYQDLWPMRLKVDSRANRRWYTEQGGGMLAAPTGGQITGFRAGRMEKGFFNGALIVDDPAKPMDAHSSVKMISTNKSFNDTLKNRLAIEEVPIILIMQRLSDNDMSGFLLRGGSGDKWYHLYIPSLITDEYLNGSYPKDYTHGIKIDVLKVLQCLRDGTEYAF